MGSSKKSFYWLNAAYSQGGRAIREIVNGDIAAQHKG